MSVYAFFFAFSAWGPTVSCRGDARSKNVGWTLIGEKGRGDCQQGRGAEPWSGIGDGETPEAKKTFIQLLLLSAFRSLVVDVT